MRMTFRTALAMILLPLCGCGTMKNTAVFITKTSFGLDVDSKPPSASISYDRVEGFYSPRFSNGGLPSVAGAIQTDGSFFDRKIQQVYATGPAASIVTDHSVPVKGAPTDLSGEREPMFFGTTTTTGLKVTFEELALSELTVGYKRKEVSIIPLGKESGKDIAGTMQYVYPSVIATLDNGYKVKEKATEAAFAEDGDNFIVAQYFATGLAAENLAHDPTVQAQFKFLARDSLQQSKATQQKLQQTAALKALQCLATLKDDQLKFVRLNAASLKIFRPEKLAEDLQKASAQAFRTAYIEQVMTADPESPEFTGRLEGHQAYVCTLAGDSAR
jgi:hypothetical protein